MARQPVYEKTLGPRVKQREPNQGPDRPAQSPAITLHGPQQQPRAGPLHPVPPSPSPPGVSATPGHKGGPPPEATTAPGEQPPRPGIFQYPAATSPNTPWFQQQWRWQSHNPDFRRQRSRPSVQASVSGH
ncbi:proline-rich protein HaeIII subfamily 1-like [Dermacentor silvarum]|uniref:proline-rich protein HaeIII subfamily 1-like n=1 Tax=Dermacentor silvarum TaxID=543639 RepID=UPI0018996416|nr:proline-rich protein HaeIII subfamily 1-like [Dermacentor silvarum]